MLYTVATVTAKNVFVWAEIILTCALLCDKLDASFIKINFLRQIFPKEMGFIN